MKAASDPKDVQDFLFKQSSTRQIFDGFKTVPSACDLVAADGKRGLIYVGHENKLTVVRCNGRSADEWKFEHELPQTVSRVALSCDNEYLSVTFHKSTARIYNAGSATTNNFELLHEIQLSSTSDDVFAHDLKWNPAIAGMFCTVASDHTIGSFVVKTERKTTVGLVAFERLDGHEVLCVAWSPKGKQIVVGCKNGNIVQLKPDLKIARTIVGPSPSVGCVTAILWISNYQFCATYQDPNDRSIKLTIVDAPKGEPRGTFTCYDDVTYGMPETETGNDLSRYYLDHVAEWGLIIAASSSSTEIAVLGSHDNGATWEQWQLVDSGRAQLPLIRTTESYPVGLAIDRSSDEKLALGPETTLPNPVPVLHIFGTSGQLVSFHMVYLSPNCPSLCVPPTEIPTAVQTRAPRPSLGPSEISFNLNSGATSTPRPKQTDFSIDRPKILPSANLFGDSAKTTPSPVPAQQPTESKIRKPRPEKIEPPTPKSDQRLLSPVKEIPSQPEKPPIDESLCLRAYYEEQTLFEKELRSKLEPRYWSCGTNDESRKLVEQISIVDAFLEELRETTNSLSSDVAALKALLLQSFAWLEETKSKNSASFADNPRDRGDRNKIKELQKSFFNIQSQLIQATKALDMEWADQDARGRSRIEIPRLEFIYQSLKSHSEIIAKEKLVVDQQSRKWKSLTRGGSKSTGLNRSMAKLNLSSSLSGSGKNPDGGAIELRCKAIASNTRSFSMEKQQKLRNMLLETKPRLIKAITPSPVQDRLEATLSSLASVVPVANSAKPKTERATAHRTPAKDETLSKITSQPSPLASLNSIVAKFGTTDTNESAIQTKTQMKPFSGTNSTTPIFGGQPPQSDKKQLNIPQIQVDSKGGFPVMLNSRGFFRQTPSNPRGQAFSEPAVVGTSESKSQEQSVPTMSTDVFSKTVKTPPSKGNFTIEGSTFFQEATTKPAAPSSTPSTVTRNESQTASSPFGSKTAHQGTTDGTAIQEVHRQPPPNPPTFGNSGQSAIGTKNSASDATTPTSSLQSFSFASKPVESPVFSFAPKDSAPVGETAVPPASDLPGLFDLGLSSIGGQPTTNKFSMPTSTTNFSDASSTASPTAVVTPPVASSPAKSSDTSAAPSTQPNIFGNAAANSPATKSTSTFEKIPSNVPASSIFGGNAATSAPTTNIFGGGTSGLASSLFAGLSTTTGPSLTSTFNVGQTPSTTSTGETPVVSSTPSIFGAAGSAATSTFAKPPIAESTATSGFPKSPLNFSASTFGAALGNSSPSVNFGATAATSPTAVDKPPETSPNAGIFGQTTPVVSPASSNVPTIPKTTAPTNLFGTAATTPATTGSVFGNMSGSFASGIFGGGTGSTGATSAFDGNSSPMAPFGTSATVFGGGVQKSPSSVFGGGAAGSYSIFGGGTAQPTSPPGQATPQAASVFAQTPAFGAKPIFGGQTSVFGAAKAEFSNPFGSTTFGAPAVPAGFSSTPAMGGSPPPLGTASMQKVFGNPVGSSTFESLAGQNGELTFGSLAQKTPEAPKPATFSGGSSFSSWR